MKRARFAMILAGGGGLRFWPLSRAARPKPLLPLAGDRSLLAETVGRLTSLFEPDRIYVVTAARLAEAVRAETPELPPENVIGEPLGRDTAAAIGVFAALAEWREPGCAFCVLPADHLVRPPERFRSDLARAFEAAERRGAPVLFGVRPSAPSKEFGYMQQGEQVEPGLFRIRAFREKPADAADLVEAGGWFWNSGMFVWRASDVLSRIERHLPALGAAVRRLADHFGTSRVPAEMQAEYARLVPISIDRGVLEKTEDALMVPAGFEWADLGTWTALAAVRAADARGNVVDARWTGLESRGCVIVGEAGRLVATLGCEDLVIVQTGDATLVASKASLPRLKELVEKLRADGHGKFL